MANRNTPRRTLSVCPFKFSKRRKWGVGFSRFVFRHPAAATVRNHKTTVRKTGWCWLIAARLPYDCSLRTVALKFCIHLAHLPTLFYCLEDRQCCQFNGMFVVNQDTARRAISPLLCTEFNLLMSAYMTKKSHSLSMKPARFNFDTSNKTTVRGILSTVETLISGMIFKLWAILSTATFILLNFQHNQFQALTYQYNHVSSM